MFLNVAKWSRGHPPELARQCIRLAGSVTDYAALLAALGHEDRRGALVLSEQADEWERLYKEEEGVLETLENTLGVRVASPISELSEKEFFQLFIDDKLGDGTADLYSDELWTSLFDYSEVRFFFRVIVPHYLLHLRSPFATWRKVWSDRTPYAALDTLLAIDQQLFHTSEVRALVHSQGPRLFKYCCSAMQRGLPSGVVKNLKTNIAVLISLASERAGQRIQEPQIRALFDAITIDRGEGLRDPDLPAQPDTFSQRIRRKRKKVKACLKTDKFLPAVVRML